MLFAGMLAAAAVPQAPAREATQVDLELVFAVDASGSISDQGRYVRKGSQPDIKRARLRSPLLSG